MNLAINIKRKIAFDSAIAAAVTPLSRDPHTTSGLPPGLSAALPVVASQTFTASGDARRGIMILAHTNTGWINVAFTVKSVSLFDTRLALLGQGRFQSVPDSTELAAVPPFPGLAYVQNDQNVIPNRNQAYVAPNGSVTYGNYVSESSIQNVGTFTTFSAPFLTPVTGLTAGISFGSTAFQVAQSGTPPVTSLVSEASLSFSLDVTLPLNASGQPYPTYVFVPPDMMECSAGASSWNEPWGYYQAVDRDWKVFCISQTFVAPLFIATSAVPVSGGIKLTDWGLEGIDYSTETLVSLNPTWAGLRYI